MSRSLRLTAVVAVLGLWAAIEAHADTFALQLRQYILDYEQRPADKALAIGFYADGTWVAGATWRQHGMEDARRVALENCQAKGAERSGPVVCQIHYENNQRVDAGPGGTLALPLLGPIAYAPARPVAEHGAGTASLQQYIDEYERLAAPKALAIGQTDTGGWVAGSAWSQDSLASARAAAVENCRARGAELGATVTCRVLYEDHRLLEPDNAARAAAAPAPPPPPPPMSGAAPASVAAAGPVASASATSAAFEEGMAAYQRKDYRTALQRWRPLAQAGDPDAQAFLGLMHAAGRGVAQDDRQAAAWYLKSARSGHAGAQFNLAVMYASGRGVARDPGQAVVWYRKAAEQGRADAQFNLGVMYDTGQGIDQDYAQAFKWFRQAAEQGNRLAQFNLAVMYARGQGVSRDDQQAVAWARKAADQDLADAQLMLGVVYSKGRGVARDDQQAAVWTRRAADHGHSTAQAGLAQMYLKGLGVPKDVPQAYFWLLLAAARGDAEAIAAQPAVKHLLTPRQAEAAAARAKHWKPKRR